jgi:hypothetical protein
MFVKMKNKKENFLNVLSMAVANLILTELKWLNFTENLSIKILQKNTIYKGFIKKSYNSSILNIAKRKIKQ